MKLIIDWGFFNVFEGQFFTRGSWIIAVGRSGVGGRSGATCTWCRSCTKLHRPYRRWMQFAGDWCVPRASQSFVHQETKGWSEGWNTSKKCYQHRHAFGSTQVSPDAVRIMFCDWNNTNDDTSIIDDLFNRSWNFYCLSFALCNWLRENIDTIFLCYLIYE